MLSGLLIPVEKASKMKKEYFMILIILLVLPFSYAQGCEKLIGSECAELEWQFAHTGAGEVAAIAIAPSNPNIIYASLENNAHAFYKSTDGGMSWKRLNGPGDHGKDIAVSATNADKAYVATSESIYGTDTSITPSSRSRFSRSFPGADAIDILSSGRSPGPPTTSFSTIEVFPGDDRILYTAVKGGMQIYGFGDTNPEIFKTANGGKIWQSIRPALDDINVIAIDPGNHEKIYLGSKDGVYKSENSGKDAQRIQKSYASIISLEVSDNLMIAASKSEVFKSVDKGDTWEEITGTLEDIHRVQMARSNNEILYASTFNGVFKSKDGGKTWLDKTSNMQARNFQIVEVHPTNPDIAFAGASTLWSSVRSEDYRTGLYAGQGIFKTSDGGNTWQKVDKGFFEYNIEDVATNPAKPYEAWFAGQASMGAHKTEDAGQHWRLTQTPTFHYPMRIKFSQQDPKKVYATGWQEGGPFSISDDGGVNWDFIDGKKFFDGLTRGKGLYAGATQGPATIHIHGLAVDPDNGDIVYAGSIYDAHSPTNFPLKGAHLWKSTDGGKSWKESDEGFPHEEKTAIHDIAVDPQNTNILYAATTSHESEKGIGIYKSTDAGKSWKEINNGLQNKDIGAVIIHPERTEILLAATHGGIYKSANAGSSWKKTSSASSFDVEYVKDMPNVVYASTNDGVLKSRDFGDTWYKVNYGLPKGEGQGIGVDPTGKVVYAAVKDKGLYVAHIVSVPAVEPVTELGSGYEGGPRGPGNGFGFPGKGFPGFPGQDEEIPDPKRGFPGSDGGIPDFALEEICEEQTWPPSCSFIPDKMGREICQKCKALEQDKEDILIDEEEKAIDQGKKPQAGKIEKEEPKKEEIKKQEGLFARIANFFKRLFGKG